MRAAFLTAWRARWRGKSLWTFSLAVVASHFFLPGLIRSDGTQSGEFEMTIRVVSGTVFALVCVAALSIGGGMFAKEREDELLPLSIVRPVSAFSLAVGRWLAVLLLFTCVVFLNTLLLNLFSFRSDYSPPDCKIHIPPALPPVEVSAAQAMEAFLKDERTPDAVKKSSTPTLFIHGADDDFVPYHMMQPLYDNCSAADKQMLTVPGSFHANAAFANNELYWNTVEEFTGKYF